MQEQVDADLEQLCHALKKPTPKQGWIKLMRQALGMTSYQLAKRMGCSQANVMAYERREVAGTISLQSLQEIAKAMNCRCVYFFVPNQPIAQLVEDQARIKVKKKMKTVGHSMELEQQGLTHQQQKKQEDSLVDEMIQRRSKYLWDDDK